MAIDTIGGYCAVQGRIIKTEMTLFLFMTGHTTLGKYGCVTPFLVVGVVAGIAGKCFAVLKTFTLQ
jgi:hypothetical protein